VRSYCEHVGEHIGSNRNPTTPPLPQKKKEKNLSPLGAYCLTSLVERNVFAYLFSRNGKNGCIFTSMDVYLSME
jgi:hypothetical protein